MKREAIYTMRGMASLAITIVCAAALAWPGQAEPLDQQTFKSAAEATKRLFEAVRANDGELIVKILGGPTELASSGDKNQDKLDRECFVQKYQQMHRMVREDDGNVILYVGAENWPFPIPLVDKDGVWRFDPETGQKEILYRRVGENELTAIATCHEFVAQDRDRGKPGTPADSFVARLAATASGDPALFHGYYFHVVKGAGGSTLVAYPAEYRSSGVMTFVVSTKDVVYEKDLGASTPASANALTAFHKDATWRTAR